MLDINNSYFKINSNYDKVRNNFKTIHFLNKKIYLMGAFVSIDIYWLIFYYKIL